MKIALGPNLADLKVELLAKVDAEAEDARSRFITLGAGQARTYDRKLLQARSFVAAHAAGDVDESAFPAVINEIGITAASAYEVARKIIAGNEKFDAIADRIEKARLGAKNQIKAAVSAAEARSAAVIEWANIASETK